MLGKLDNEKIRFLNAIEYPWYTSWQRSLFQKTWTPCDQVIMAVFLNEECVESREEYWVTLKSDFLKNTSMYKILRVIVTQHYFVFYAGNCRAPG